MKNILEVLCQGEYGRSPHMTAKMRELCEKGEPLWNLAYEKMGRDAGEQLLDHHGALLMEEGYERFRDGFQLGALLMLELLYTSPQ